jgi:beta-xylosidase
MEAPRQSRTGAAPSRAASSSRELNGQEETPRADPSGQYSFVAIRQPHFRFEANTQMTFAPSSVDEEAGLVVIQNDESAYLMTVSAGSGGREVRLQHSLYGEVSSLAEHPYDSSKVHL